MNTGIIKWHKGRYFIAAFVVINLLLANLLFGSPITIPNPFRPSLHEVPDSFKPISSRPASPTPISSETAAPKPPPVEPATPNAVAIQSSQETISATSHPQDYSFDGEYVGWPLQRVCEEAQWSPGLTFVCDNNSGGIGNIKNFILTCIRYAIDAGATQLIMPRIQKRSQEHLGKLFTTTYQPFEYFFDREHFLQSMQTSCPQIKIFNTLEEIPNAAKLLKIEEFFPKDLNDDYDRRDKRGANKHLDMFHTEFHKWLNMSRRDPSAEEPISIRMKWPTFFEWPIYRDGPEFAATFGEILRMRKDVQELAAKTLAEMSRFTGTEPTPPTLNAPFLGVHLRTESDALVSWPDFWTQSEGYLKQAEVQGLQHAYLACGDENEANHFTDKALNRTTPLRVATKMTLLQGEDLTRLKSLSWDQQALVDFLVLTKSTHFTGCSFSSFTMNVAFRRHLMTDGIKTRQWKNPGDQFSTLVGRFDSWFSDWMFMYECMWP